MNLFDKRNPFERNYVKDRKLFSGERHNDVLKEIESKLKTCKNEKTGRSFLIQGNRGCGKSSILNILMQDVENYNFIPIELFLDESLKAPNKFYEELLRQAISKLTEYTSEEVSTQLNLELSIFQDSKINNNHKILSLFNALVREPNKTVNSTPIKNDLEQLHNEVLKKNNKYKLVFFIDESQKIYESQLIWETLRRIIQDDIGVSFIMAGEPLPEKSMPTQVFQNFHAGFDIKELKYLEEIKDIDHLFKNTLKGLGDIQDANPNVEASTSHKEKINKKIEKGYFKTPEKYRKLLHQIKQITDGEPRFILQIAAAMWDEAHHTNKKMKLSYPLLNNVILPNLKNNAESTQEVPISKEKTILLSFDENRIYFILNLNPLERKWLNILVGTIWARGKDIFRVFQSLFNPDNNFTYEGFCFFLRKLEENNVLFFFHESKNIKQEITFSRKNEEKALNIGEIQYRYTGSPNESKYINLVYYLNKFGSFHPNTSNKSALYGLRRYLFSLFPTGNRGTHILSKSRFPVFNSAGIQKITSDINFEEILPKFSLKGLLEKVKSDNTIIEDLIENETISMNGVIHLMHNLVYENKKEEPVEILTVLTEDRISKENLACLFYKYESDFEFQEFHHYSFDLNNLKENSEKNPEFFFDYKVEKINYNELPQSLQFKNLLKEKQFTYTNYLIMLELAPKIRTHYETSGNIKGYEEDVNLMLIYLKNSENYNLQHFLQFGLHEMLNNLGYMSLSNNVNLAYEIFEILTKSSGFDSFSNSNQQLYLYNFGISLFLKNNIRKAIYYLEKALSIYLDSDYLVYCVQVISENKKGVQELKMTEKELEKTNGQGSVNLTEAIRTSIKILKEITQ